MEIGVRDCAPQARAENAANTSRDPAADRGIGRLSEPQERRPSGTEDPVDRHAANARFRNRLDRVRSVNDNETLCVTMRATPWVGVYPFHPP